MQSEEYFRYTADQCRHLARAIDRPDDLVVEGLLKLADEFEAMVPEGQAGQEDSMTQ